jgi:membrane-associated protease RseP (regulator of RpoE activity)
MSDRDRLIIAGVAGIAFLLLCIGLPLVVAIGARDQIQAQLAGALPAGDGATRWVGIRMIELQDDILTQLNLPRTARVLITGVYPGSPAEQAGLEPFDVIVEVNGEPIVDLATADDLLNRAKAGSQLTLAVLRLAASGQTQTRWERKEVTVRPVPRPNPAQVSSWETYENPDFEFAIDYPANWLKDEMFQAFEGVVFSAPTLSDDLVEVRFWSDPNTSLDDFYQQFIAQVRSSLAAARVESETTTTVANRSARRVVVSYRSTTRNRDMTDNVVLFLADDRWFLVRLSATRENYSQLLPVFDRMLQSFRLTG